MIGAVLVENFPFDIRIESDAVGGPSAGLMWALGLADLLTEGDLTGGRSIAGTGTIDLRGRVGPIGGVEKKVRAAQRAGAEMFFVPVENLAAARTTANGIRLVAVRSLGDALGHLEAAG